MGSKYKCQHIMACTRYPSFGWSESYIFDFTDGSTPSVTQALARLQLMVGSRLSLGGPQTVCVGFRVVPLDSAGERPTIKTLSPPLAGYGASTDAPFTCMEIAATSAVGNRRVFRWAGMDDSQVVGGLFQPPNNNPTGSFQLRALLADSYIDAYDRLQPQSEIVSITPAGLVTTYQAHGFGPNMKVRFLRVRNINGVNRSGTYIVQTVPSSYSFTVASWPEASLIEDSGTVQQRVSIYSKIVSLGDPVIVSRKLGRPIGVPRARRWARKAH